MFCCSLQREHQGNGPGGMSHLHINGRWDIGFIYNLSSLPCKAFVPTTIMPPSAFSVSASHWNLWYFTGAHKSTIGDRGKGDRRMRPSGGGSLLSPQSWRTRVGGGGNHKPVADVAPSGRGSSSSGGRGRRRPSGYMINISRLLESLSSWSENNHFNIFLKLK